MNASTVELSAATEPRVAQLLARINALPMHGRTALQDAELQYLGDLLMLEVCRSSLPPAQYRAQRLALTVALAQLVLEPAAPKAEPKLTRADPGRRGSGCEHCDDAGFAWLVEGLDGYVDACHEHKVAVAMDALAEQAKRLGGDL